MYLNIKQLRYFLAAVEAGSLRKAAEKLAVSQPTMSAQITALERQLEVNLLERGPRGTLPTAVGRGLLPHIQKLLQTNHEIVSIARDASQSPSGIHRLGVPYTLGPYLLPDVIPEIHRIFPTLRFFVKEDTPRKLGEGLLDGAYDVILTPLPLEIEQLSCEILFSEPLYMVAAPDHPLADHRNILPEQFTRENFLTIEERHRFFSHVQQVAKNLGFRLLRDYEGTSLDTLRQMIGTGLGISFLPSLYVRSEITHRRDVITLDLGFELPHRQIALAWRPGSLQKQLYRQIGGIIRAICKEALEGHVSVEEIT